MKIFENNNFIIRKKNDLLMFIREEHLDILDKLYLYRHDVILDLFARTDLVRKVFLIKPFEIIQTWAFTFPWITIEHVATKCNTHENDSGFIHIKEIDPKNTADIYVNIKNMPWFARKRLSKTNSYLVNPLQVVGFHIDINTDRLYKLRDELKLDKYFHVIQSSDKLEEFDLFINKDIPIPYIVTKPYNKHNDDCILLGQEAYISVRFKDNFFRSVISKFLDMKDYIMIRNAIKDIYIHKSMILFITIVKINQDNKDMFQVNISTFDQQIIFSFEPHELSKFIDYLVV